MELNDKIKNYLKIQVGTGKLTKEEVVNKYPEMEEYLD